MRRPVGLARFKKPLRPPFRRKNVREHCRRAGMQFCFAGGLSPMIKLMSTAVFVFGILIVPAAAPAQHVTAAYVSKDLNYLPFFIGLKKGLYAKEGVQADLVSIGRADIQLQALVAGELQFANMNAD